MSPRYYTNARLKPCAWLKTVFTLYLLTFTSIPAANQYDSLNLLFLGDSYSVGEGINPKDGWPQQLSEKLQKKHISITSLKTIAQTGWTTNRLIDAIHKNKPTPIYDYVFVLIGVNDQVRWRTYEQFEENFSQLIDIAIQLSRKQTPSQVVALSIPDYGVTPAGQRYGGATASAELTKFNQTIKAVCLVKHCQFIDITKISQLAENDDGLLASDLLHPSKKMYKLWVDKIIENIINFN